MTAKIVVEMDLIWREEYNQMIFYLEQIGDKMKRNVNSSKIMKSEEKWIIVDRFSIETTIWSVEK